MNRENNQNLATNTICLYLTCQTGKNPVINPTPRLGEAFFHSHRYVLCMSQTHQRHFSVDRDISFGCIVWLWLEDFRSRCCLSGHIRHISTFTTGFCPLRLQSSNAIRKGILMQAAHTVIYLNSIAFRVGLF